MNFEEELNKFKKVDIKPDLSSLSSKEKKLLLRLIDAANILHEIFLDQVHPKNIELRESLKKSNLNNVNKSLIELFELHCSPFDCVTHKPFFDNYSRLKGANFYPEDMTVEEFNNYLEKNPDKKEKFMSNYTIIKRSSANNSDLISIPYPDRYKDKLKEICALLRDASKFTDDKSLKNYLEKLSDSLLSNNYFDSDCAWIDLDSKFEILFGPYEVYRDELLGLKATYEAVIGLVDKKASSELKFLEQEIEELEQNLPLQAKHKFERIGKTSPIIIMDEIYSAGDCRAGIHFTAFNLPNDEKVKSVKGSKKVMLKNIAKAKYEYCMTPIIKEVFDKEPLKHTDFDSYFTHILLHEISHGIGPGFIKKDKKKISVNQALKELYSTIEEAKADVLGVYNSFYLEKKGIYSSEFAKKIMTSYIGGIFRSLRFGANEAHGGANLIVLNYLMNSNALIYTKTGKFEIRYDVAKSCFSSLAENILLLQAEGDYNAAKRFIEQYKDLTPGIKSILEKLKSTPIDIKPVYHDFKTLLK